MAFYLVLLSNIGTTSVHLLAEAESSNCRISELFSARDDNTAQYS